MNLFNRNISIFIFIIFPLALGACLVGPDFEPPVIETPEFYRFSDYETGEEVNLKWWELFNDPVLIQLVNTALENNKDVQIALSRIEEARAQLKFVGADQYPVIDVEGGAVRGNSAGGTILSDTTDTAFISPVISWELDLWGKFRRATESARADLISTEFAARSIQITLITDVVNSYFLLLDFHQRLLISKNTLESRDESLDIIQKRFDEGIIAELDLNQAQVQREIAATAIPLMKG